MSLPAVLIRLVLATCSFLAVVPPLHSAEPEPVFVAELLRVTEPIHVTPDVHVSSLSAPQEQGPVKATIAPQVWCSSHTLGGKVYDVSEALRNWSITLPRGSCALYSPEAQLLYIHSTFDDVEKIKAILYRESPPREFTVDVRAILKSDARQTTLLDMKAVPLSAGREMEFRTSGEESLHLTIEPFPGAAFYEEVMHLGVEAEVRAQGKSVTVRSTWLAHHAKPLEATLGKLGDATVTLSIQMHQRQGYWGVDAESEKEGKAAAIKEIQDALKAGK